ncbi:hypothetical protein [Polaribacter sp.]|uniref:hypothetical protein n=1 Tax=Polaribacter sp. TaxID=1920175 RepID=UPI003F69FEBE
MKKHVINQTLVVLVTSTILYFSGFYLASMEGIQNLFDGFVVMIFFIAIFPFLANAFRLTHNFIKSLFNVLAI